MSVYTSIVGRWKPGISLWSCCCTSGGSCFYVRAVLCCVFFCTGASTVCMGPSVNSTYMHPILCCVCAVTYWIWTFWCIAIKWLLICYSYVGLLVYILWSTCDQLVASITSLLQFYEVLVRYEKFFVTAKHYLPGVMVWLYLCFF